MRRYPKSLLCDGLLVSLDKEISVAGVHLLSQGQNLQFIPRIFEENQVMTVKADASTIFSLMKYVLYDINDPKIAMMRTSGKQDDDSLVSASIFHLIGDHH